MKSDLTREEKLQAILRGYFPILLETFDDYQDGYYIEAGLSDGTIIKAYTWDEAVDWLYENTVGKK